MFNEYSHCELCPHCCGVNRNDGKAGVCGETAECRIAAVTPHFGEEPCLTGRHGSGTIFFSGCSCGCMFCQNFQISQQHQGELKTPEQLLEEVEAMVAKGVHNLNFVTPEHYWPHIKWLCEHVRERHPDLPFVWNSSGYSRVEMLEEQTKLIDIFLPDFKYADSALAHRCMKAADYPEVARKALRYLVDTVGKLRPFDESGDITASRGVMVRHLVLPGQIDNTLTVLDWLYEDFGPSLPISIMSQFTPVPACQEQNFLNRRLTKDEYQQVCDKVEHLGFYKVFLQPDFGDDAFMPDFNEKQPFAGNRTV